MEWLMRIEPTLASLQDQENQALGVPLDPACDGRV